MNKLLLGLTVASFAYIAVSCSGSAESNKEERDSTVVVDSSKMAPEDTVLTMVKNGDTIQERVIKLPTTEAQLKYMKESPNWAKYESGILPQMAEEVPKYCEKLLQNKYDRFIIVDKGKMTLFLYDKYGNIEKKYGIACARNYGTKQKFGDSRTTEGFFTAEGIYDSTNWLFTNDAGYTSPTKGVYGPRFIRLTTPYIGIHGTGSPGSIGKRCSHGCIRVTNDNIMEIVKLVEAGIPIIISPGPKDMAVNKSAGINMPSVTTEPGGTRAVPGSVDPAQLNPPVSTGSAKKDKQKEEVKEDNSSETPAVEEVKQEHEQTPAPTQTPAKEEAPAPKNVIEPVSE